MTKADLSLLGLISTKGKQSANIKGNYVLTKCSKKMKRNTLKREWAATY